MKYSYHILITGVFLMAFVMVPQLYDKVLLPRYILLSVMVLLLVVLNRKFDYSILTRWLVLACFGWLCFSALSLSQAINVSEGIPEVLKVFVSFVWLVLIASIVIKKGDITSLAFVIAIIGGYLCAIAAGCFISDYSLGLFESGQRSVIATMANRNLLSSALFMTLPFCIYYSFKHKIVLIFVVAIILGIILLNSKAVWLAVLTATVATGLLWGYFSPKYGRLAIYGTVAACIVACVACFILYPYFEGCERDIMWKASLSQIMDKPILGYGVGNWKIAIHGIGIQNLPYRSSLDVYVRRPHNDYIWILHETGVFGLLCYLGMFGAVIIYVCRILDRPKKDKLLTYMMFFGVMGYMVIAFFSYLNERIFHSVIIFLMMGIILAQYHVPKEPKQYSFINVIVCVLLLCSILVGAERARSETHWKLAREYYNARRWESVIKEMDAASSILSTMDIGSTPHLYSRGHSKFELGRIDEALEDYLIAYKHHPYYRHLLNKIGICYAYKDQLEEARKYFELAFENWEHFEPAILNLAITYYNLERYEEAYAMLERATYKDTPDWKKYMSVMKTKI